MREPILGQALMDEKGNVTPYFTYTAHTDSSRVELCPGDYVTISASRYPFANVMPPGRRSEDWVNSISRTLQWNSRQRQKAFQEWDGGKEEEKENKNDGRKQEEAEDRQDHNRGGEGHPGWHKS